MTRAKPAAAGPAPHAGAAPFVPHTRSLSRLAKAVEQCRGCELYRGATHGVFGEGKRGARLVLVGEQPGDQEDRTGRPFVGPAGRLLDELLAAAGIERGDAFVTNTVKHFRYVWRGKARKHQKPSLRQVRACRPWLDAELELVQPRVLVCLGATAAQALMRTSFRIQRDHGKPEPTPFCERTLATWHPSALLRAPDADRRRLRRTIVHDLERVATLLRDGAHGS